MCVYMIDTLHNFVNNAYYFYPKTMQRLQNSQWHILIFTLAHTLFVCNRFLSKVTGELNYADVGKNYEILDQWAKLFN